jgi:anti-sigma regulatory factor (Ser/Thr protein kinase)
MVAEASTWSGKAMSPLNTVIVPVLCEWDVEADLGAVPLARREVVQLVRSWGVPITEDAARDVELCADELLANAVEHTGEQCRVAVQWTGVRLRVQVSDSSPRPPDRSTADDAAINGRGLLLVEALAHSWGWCPVETGKVVWFEIVPDQTVTGDARLAALVLAAQVRAEQPGRTCEKEPEAEVVR